MISPFEKRIFGALPTTRGSAVGTGSTDTFEGDLFLDRPSGGSGPHRREERPATLPRRHLAESPADHTNLLPYVLGNLHVEVREQEGQATERDVRVPRGAPDPPPPPRRPLHASLARRHGPIVRGGVFLRAGGAHLPPFETPRRSCRRAPGIERALRRRGSQQESRGQRVSPATRHGRSGSLLGSAAVRPNEASPIPQRFPGEAHQVPSVSQHSCRGRGNGRARGPAHDSWQTTLASWCARARCFRAMLTDKACGTLGSPGPGGSRGGLPGAR